MLFFIGKCGSNHTQCHYGLQKFDNDVCIPDRWLNDGWVDCEDGSDETETKGLL